MCVWGGWPGEECTHGRPTPFPMLTPHKGMRTGNNDLSLERNLSLMNHPSCPVRRLNEQFSTLESPGTWSNRGGQAVPRTQHSSPWAGPQEARAGSRLRTAGPHKIVPLRRLTYPSG